MTTQTQTVAEFVLARIAEDEADAKAAAGVHGPDWGDDFGMVNGSKQYLSHDLYRDKEHDRWNLWECEGALCTSSEASRHMARHDPARILADCAAKRRIVELHAGGLCPTCGYEDDDGDGGFTTRQQIAPCDTLRALASAYADHPDFRDEWRA